MSGHYPGHPYVGRENNHQSIHSHHEQSRQKIAAHPDNDPQNVNYQMSQSGRPLSHQYANQPIHQMSNPTITNNYHVNPTSHIPQHQDQNGYHHQPYSQSISYNPSMQSNQLYEMSHNYQYAPSAQQQHLPPRHGQLPVQHDLHHHQFWSPNNMDDLAELPMIQSLIDVSDDEYDLRSHVGTSYQQHPFTPLASVYHSGSARTASQYDNSLPRSMIASISPTAEPIMTDIPVHQYPASQPRFNQELSRQSSTDSAVKNEIRSPASTTENSASMASSKSLDSMDVNSTNSSTHHKLSTKSSPISRLPFSFIVHLRAGDRSFVPRRVITTLDRDIGDLLQHAAGIRDFIAVHSEGATRTADGPLADLPIVQSRLSVPLADACLKIDQLPVFEQQPPVLLSASTQLGMPFVPPLVSSGKKPISMDSDDDDDADVTGPVNKAVHNNTQSSYLSDAINIHLLFDLAENMKPCTRLGCMNMMLKKSSRRACDECQNHGHRVDPALLRKVFVPENRTALSPQSTDPVVRDFLALSLDQSVLVVNQLSEAIDTALISTRVEYWKFHVPEEQCYVYAFVSQEAAESVINHFERLLNPFYVGKSNISSASSTQALNASSLTMNMTVAMTSQMGRNDNAYESSRSRSQQSDSELEPQLVRKNSHSRSHSSKSSTSIPSSASRSSGDIINDRSTMSTASSGSSHSGGVTASDVSSPLRSNEFCAQLPNLVPKYLYANHVRTIDDDLEYWVRMKSHFWKLEVRPKVSATSQSRKQAKTKSYRKVGKATKRPSNRKRASMHINHSSLGNRYNDQQERPVDSQHQISSVIGTVPTLSPDHHQPQYRAEPSWPTYDRSTDHVVHDRTIPSLTETRGSSTSRVPHPLSNNTTPSVQHRPANLHSNASTHLPMDQSDQVDRHACRSSFLPVFQDERARMTMTDELSSPFMRDDAFDSSAMSPTHLNNNSVLIHASDHNQLTQQKPVGAMLNIYSGTRRSVAHGSAMETRHDDALNQIPVLLVYRDPRVFQNDVRQGYMPSLGGNGNNGGGNSDNDRHPDQDHKDESGGNYGTRRRDDFEDYGGGNGKRRRIDAHHLALDAPGANNPLRRDSKHYQSHAKIHDDITAVVDNGNDDDDLKKKPHQAEQKSALLASIIAVQHQSLNIWLSLLVLISAFSVALFVVNFAAVDTPLSVLRQVPNPALISSHQRSTLVNAANIFNQMRVASSVFNSWIHDVPDSNITLIDDDPTTDIAYSLSWRQLDIQPGSVVSMLSPLKVVKASTVPQSQGIVLTYSDVLQRCGEASNTAKGVADFLVSANSLGNAFSYHFIGTELSNADTSLDEATEVDDSDLSTLVDDAPEDAPSSSSTGTSEARVFDMSTAEARLRQSSSFGDGQVPAAAAATDSFILGVDMSTLSYPPKPAVTCELMNNEVGLTFIQSSLCAAVGATQSPYALLLEEQCDSPDFNCTRFLTDLFNWNLTNIAFAVETAVYNTDALLIALHYRQEVAALAPVCSYFQIATHEQLDIALEGAVQGEINVTILLLLILSGAALFVILLGSIVWALFVMKQGYEKRNTPIPAHAVLALPLQYDDARRMPRQHTNHMPDELNMPDEHDNHVQMATVG